MSVGDDVASITLLHSRVIDREPSWHHHEQPVVVLIDLPLSRPRGAVQLRLLAVLALLIDEHFLQVDLARLQVRKRAFVPTGPTVASQLKRRSRLRQYLMVVAADALRFLLESPTAACLRLKLKLLMILESCDFLLDCSMRRRGGGLMWQCTRRQRATRGDQRRFASWCLSSIETCATFRVERLRHLLVDLVLLICGAVVQQALIAERWNRRL